MNRERWMALFFALGSTCFLIGPFLGYAQLVAPTPTRPRSSSARSCSPPAGRYRPGSRSPSAIPTAGAAWPAATIQSAGTLFFNVTTYQAVHTSLSNSHYDRLGGGQTRSARSAS